MFVYNIRAFDRYNKEVVSLAVLADEQPAWREDHFEYGRWGGRTRLDFLPVKLLDYRGREAALERDANPFAQVVLAHLQALATRQDPAEVGTRCQGQLDAQFANKEAVRFGRSKPVRTV